MASAISDYRSGKFGSCPYSVGLIALPCAMTEAYLVYTGNTGKEITLHYITGEIKKSDSETLYLGKTQSFYYLYDKPNKKAIIIDADRINCIEIE